MKSVSMHTALPHVATMTSKATAGRKGVLTSFLTTLIKDWDGFV